MEKEGEKEEKMTDKEKDEKTDKDEDDNNENDVMARKKSSQVER
jgi:hypothetical protein